MAFHKAINKLYWMYCARCGVRTDHALEVRERVEIYTCQTLGCGAVKEYVVR